MGLIIDLVLEEFDGLEATVFAEGEHLFGPGVVKRGTDNLLTVGENAETK